MMGRHPVLRRLTSVLFFLFFTFLLCYGFYTVDRVCRCTLWGEEVPLLQTTRQENGVEITIQGFGRHISFTVPDFPRIVNNLVEYVDKKITGSNTVSAGSVRFWQEGAEKPCSPC